jgi:hypothetical protein
MESSFRIVLDFQDGISHQAAQPELQCQITSDKPLHLVRKLVVKLIRMLTASDDDVHLSEQAD